MTFKVTEKIINDIEKMAGLGLTINEIAVILNTSSRTIDRRIADNQEVKLAFKKGRIIAKQKVVSRLFDKIENGNLTAIIFYLKTQCGWREKDNSENILPKNNVTIYLPEKEP